MLNKKEKAIMKVIYELSKKKDSFFVEEIDIFTKVDAKHKLTIEEIGKSMKRLEIDGYFEVVKTEKKGEEVLLVTIKKGRDVFERQLEQDRRTVQQRITMAIITAIVGGIVTLIIRTIGS